MKENSFARNLRRDELSQCYNVESLENLYLKSYGPH